jgi:hypothetical protein
MCETELPFLEWSKKVTERLTFIHLNIQNLRDISEPDYELLGVLHRVWYRGELPFYQTKLELSEEKSVQTGLFATESQTSTNGKIVEYVNPEPKTEEK